MVQLLVQSARKCVGRQRTAIGLQLLCTLYPQSTASLHSVPSIYRFSALCTLNLPLLCTLYPQSAASLHSVPSICRLSALCTLNLPLLCTLYPQSPYRTLFFTSPGCGFPTLCNLTCLFFVLFVCCGRILFRKILD